MFQSMADKKKLNGGGGAVTNGSQDSLDAMDLPDMEDVGGKKGSKSGGGGGKRLSVERIYQKKTQHEHILLRPDTYIGSVEKVTTVRN